jgi:choice-of-anchor A domain-containing protein
MHKLSTLAATVGILAFLLLAPGKVQATSVNPFIALSGAGNYQALTLGGCTTAPACDAGTTNMMLENGSTITGNIGVAPSGNFAISHTTVNGTGYIGGGNINTGSGSSITGGTVVSGSSTNALEQAAISALTAYAEAQAGSNITNYNLLTVNGGGVCGGTNNICGPSNELTVTGAANKINVLNLSNLVLSNAADGLTLNGPANADFIINITGNFALTNGASIVLTGGVLPTNVLFNVIGTNGNGSANSPSGVCFSSESQNNSCATNYTGTPQGQISGIVLAPYRDITLDGVIVNGEVISGDLNLTISDSQEVPEPATLLLFASGLAVLRSRCGRRRHPGELRLPIRRLT